MSLDFFFLCARALGIATKALNFLHRENYRRGTWECGVVPQYPRMGMRWPLCGHGTEWHHRHPRSLSPRHRASRWCLFRGLRTSFPGGESRPSKKLPRFSTQVSAIAHQRLRAKVIFFHTSQPQTTVYYASINPFSIARASGHDYIARE